MDRLTSTRARLLIVALALLLTACGSDSGSESASDGQGDKPKAAIKIGFLGPLSGDNASAGAKKLAILHNNTVYAKGLADQTRAANDELRLGMEIVFFDAITPGERDYSSALTKIKASGADTLYFTGYLAEAGLIVRQAKELRLPLRLSGGDATQDP